MAKFALTASKSTTAPSADQLTFHATMSLEQFVEAGYCAKGTFGVTTNPQGNKHPKNLFMHWKNAEGVAFSGAVSSKILTVEDIKNPVLSIVNTPDSADLFVLFHNEAERANGNDIFSF